jgi:hypothetical protein
MQAQRRHRPAWLQFVVAATAALVLVAGYWLALRLTIDVTRVGPGHTDNYRDTVYLAIHAGLLAGAAIVGFVAGKWLNGLGLGYALLLMLVLSVAMVGTQVGAHTLACHGHNDLVRHWTC